MRKSKKSKSDYMPVDEIDEESANRAAKKTAEHFGITQEEPKPKDPEPD